MPNRPEAVAFDIIETVFSLDPLRVPLVAMGLPPASLELLYATTLRDSACLAAAKDFQPFRTCMEGALDEVLARLDRWAEPAAKKAVLDLMKELPAQPHAAEAFGILKEAGIRVVALSNGAKANTEALLKGAGLDGSVDLVFSIDQVGSAKPKREVYLYAAAQAKVDPAHLGMVACHPWDLHGAKLAGLITGYVARGRPYSPAMKPPDVSGETLADVARALSLL